jgi:hypothetical protein
MVFGDMSLQEFLFQGRYHLLGLALLLWVGVLFVQEWARHRTASRAAQPAIGPSFAAGVLHDPLLGATMADGGEEPVTPPRGPTD